MHDAVEKDREQLPVDAAETVDMPLTYQLRSVRMMRGCASFDEPQAHHDARDGSAPGRTLDRDRIRH
ncbi:MAG: hypothetical protein CVT59_05600 [Actinobacteria bacterium HGW-Actinobacteria-1]|nr:MAG: hypothetical protein CVT59_05600 [Actinobacteria bacterium HGW-Actinobacteria-1]